MSPVWLVFLQINWPLQHLERLTFQKCHRGGKKGSWDHRRESQLGTGLGEATVGRQHLPLWPPGNRGFGELGPVQPLALGGFEPVTFLIPPTCSQVWLVLPKPLYVGLKVDN